MGIVKLSLKNTKTNVDNKNGTINELEIIKPTTTGRLPPMKFTTKGDPNPVDIPDNKNIASLISSEIGMDPVI